MAKDSYHRNLWSQQIAFLSPFFPICPFCHLSAQDGDDGAVQGDDGTAAACLTEHTCPTAT